MCWIRHWRRTWGNLTKYNVGRWLENDLEEGPDGMHKEEAPDIVRGSFFVESGNVLLSQVIFPA